MWHSVRVFGIKCVRYGTLRAIWHSVWVVAFCAICQSVCDMHSVCAFWHSVCAIWHSACNMAFSLGCGILCDMPICVRYGTSCGIWHSLRDMAPRVCDMAFSVCIYGIHFGLWHSLCDMPLCVRYGTLCAIWHFVWNMAFSEGYGTQCV